VRACAATFQLRIAAVGRILLEGGSRRAVLQHAAHHWGLSSRQTDRLLALARQQICRDWDAERLILSSQLLAKKLARSNTER
jgi:hypothetical protein